MYRFRRRTLTNVIAAMYNYIALQNASITLPFWVEFPTSHQILEEGELTDMEKQYAEYGDKFPLTKVKYDNGQVTKIND